MWNKYSRLTIFFLLILAVPAMLMAAGKPDMRQFSWGDSLKKVVSKEKAPVFKEVEGSAPLYKDKFLGIDAVVGYIFLEDKLQGGIYIFKASHENKSEYNDDYNKVLAFLKDKYGEPKAANRYWKDEEAKKAKSADVTKWGEAMYNGELSVVAEWQTPRSVISHTIGKDKDELLHILTISSMALVKEKTTDKAPEPSGKESPSKKEASEQAPETKKGAMPKKIEKSN